MSSVIEQAVQARLVAADPRTQTVTASLRYDRDDPFAVRIDFPPPATLENVEVAWTFARELLEDGLDGEAGEGDVRVRPYGFERTVLEFHAPEGTALVHIRTTELRRFLSSVEELVPAGREHLYLDMDHDLAELLRDAL
ncbi:SsgA family sporulation/cell division regulator [Streptomyces sp. GC420]|uniref:SsgA family sporulation/cell division regulator n=1 Tax=Streptomyces sp. GC420 TaxID=2697568 RepID=UPI0014152F15|nr:SsgA family sporulation/cell division regulator [Streptomyces sp. GC420]NBM17372.1 SsgA family sporulation/cell division regulator [Streptomyces sp. GC420]